MKFAVELQEKLFLQADIIFAAIEMYNSCIFLNANVVKRSILSGLPVCVCTHSLFTP